MRKIVCFLMLFLGVVLLSSSSGSAGSANSKVNYVELSSMNTIHQTINTNSFLNFTLCSSVYFIRCEGCGYWDSVTVYSTTFWEWLFEKNRIQCPGCGRDNQSCPPIEIQVHLWTNCEETPVPPEI